MTLQKGVIFMLFLDILSFKDLCIRLLGELSPSMYWLYDVLAVVAGFLFIMIIYKFLDVVLSSLKRW